MMHKNIRSVKEDRVAEIRKVEQKNEKLILKNEDSLREHWKNIKHSNV